MAQTSTQLHGTQRGPHKSYRRGDRDVNPKRFVSLSSAHSFLAIATLLARADDLSTDSRSIRGPEVSHLDVRIRLLDLISHCYLFLISFGAKDLGKQLNVRFPDYTGDKQGSEVNTNCSKGQ